MKLHHIGICIKKKNIHKFSDLFINLGGIPYKKGICEKYQTHCHFIKFGDILIELVSDTNNGSLMNKRIQRHGEGLHHLAFIKKGIKREIRGALPRMWINFKDLKDTERILVEEVDFDEMPQV